MTIGEFFKMKYFPSFLTKNVFMWFNTLTLNSILNLWNLKTLFCDQFLKEESKVNVVHIAKIKREIMNLWIIRLEIQENEDYMFNHNPRIWLNTNDNNIYELLHSKEND